MNNRENKATCDYQREAQMVIQLGFIQRFVVSVRKDVSYREKKVGLEKLEVKQAELLIKQRARRNYFFTK